MATTVISVRGESTRMVDPDSAVFDGTIELVRENQQEALAGASAALDAVLAGMTRLGGVAATAISHRAPLTYSAGSVSTREEYGHDERSGNFGPTGRISAAVSVEFVVRDMQLVQPVQAELSRHPTLHTHGVSWRVDEDNPAWQECRADAAHAALRRARGYAAALGGTVRELSELADTGLLSEQSPAPAARLMAARTTEAPNVPSLTPVPQRVYAAVNARVLAEVPSLGS